MRLDMPSSMLGRMDRFGCDPRLFGGWLRFRRVECIADAGLVMSSQSLLALGTIAFSTIVLFQLVTLPVEFDASARAKRWRWKVELSAKMSELE